MNTHPPAGDDFPVPLDAIMDGRISDDTVRNVIRFGLSAQLRAFEALSVREKTDKKMRMVNELRASPFLEGAKDANEQQYEVSADFFRIMLGKRMKYSCGLWTDDTVTVDDAQEAMLDLMCDRAGLEDGQAVLDLGCGWGALPLYLAERFPNSRIVAMSNSRSQRSHIENLTGSLRIANVAVHTGNIADWHTDDRFDRIVSSEMFEHVRNYELLFAKVARWLKPSGRLFVQVISHRADTYLFSDNWMARRFFTGGIMPSADLFMYFQRDLLVDCRWDLEGTHYARTQRGWLDAIDAERERVLQILGRDAPGLARRRLTEWRLYLLSIIEAYGFNGGNEWMTSQYLFRPR